MDYEEVVPLSHYLEQAIIARLPALLSQVDIIALSDYGKGMLTAKLIQALVAYADRAAIPVIVDPKGSDYRRYRGCFLLKPNEKRGIYGSTPSSAF